LKYTQINRNIYINKKTIKQQNVIRAGACLHARVRPVCLCFNEVSQWASQSLEISHETLFIYYFAIKPVILQTVILDPCISGPNNLMVVSSCDAVGPCFSSLILDRNPSLSKCPNYPCVYCLIGRVMNKTLSSF